MTDPRVSISSLEQPAKNGIGLATPGTTVTTVGWGRTSNAVGSVSPDLLQVDLTVDTTEDCLQLFPGPPSTPAYSGNGQFCTTSTITVGACKVIKSNK